MGGTDLNVTYLLQGNPLTRGFSLLHNNALQFKTHHFLGWFPKSVTPLDGEKIEINPKNIIGDTLDIKKSGVICGEIDFSKAAYAQISLNRLDGETDVFRLDAIGFQQEYVLHSQGQSPILKIKYSLNPIKLDNKYWVEELDPSIPKPALRELMLYCGEILFRNPMI